MADPIEHIATCMIGAPENDHEYEITWMYEALQPVLSKADFLRLGAMLDLCPVHFSDINSCYDDGLHREEVYELDYVPEEETDAE